MVVIHPASLSPNEPVLERPVLEHPVLDQGLVKPDKIRPAIAPVESLLRPEFSPIRSLPSQAIAEVPPPEQSAISSESIPPVDPGLPAQPSETVTEGLPPPSPVPPNLPVHPEGTPTASDPSAPGASSDTFERVFGHSHSNETQQIIVPFYIDDQLQGQIPILTATRSASTIRVQAAILLGKLGDAIRPDILQQLTAAIDPGGNLSLDTLQQVGLSAVFDDRRLDFRIQIPPALRRTNVYSAGTLPPDAASALRPSTVSGYLNLRLGQDFIWTGQAAIQGRQPIQSSVDGAVNVSGWVLEGSMSFAEDNTPALTRGDIRVVRDDPERAIRYTVGDLAVPVTGYQSSLPMLGIAAVRNFSIQPYRITRPINRFEFLLERPSTVEVLINGSPTQTLRLPAGTQDIRNLPLSGGVNNIELIITDDLGQVQRLSFPASVAGDLLSPGLQQFAYSFGFPSQTENGVRTYHWDDPTLTMTQRWGVNNQLTLGGYLQANLRQQLVGVEGIWATSRGNWGWNIAISRDSESRIDGAATLEYELTRSLGSGEGQQSLRLAAEYRGQNFTPLGDLVPKNDYSFDLSAAYSRPLFAGMNVNLTGRYQIGRGEIGNSYSIGLGLSQSFTNGIGLNLNLTQQQRSNGQGEQQATLSIFWLLPQQRQSVVSTTSLSTRSDPNSQLIWSINSDRSIDGTNSSITVSDTPDQHGLSGQLFYTGYRLEASLSQELTVPKADTNPMTNMTRLTLGTSIAFADGHWAWSRPITDSFAMIVRRANLRSQVLQVNPTGNGASARADGAGNAVLPGLQPYSIATVQINAPSLPVGYEVGQRQFSLLPTYRSGTAIYVGTEGTVFLRGILVDQNRAAIALQAGSIVSLSDTHWASVTLFTNQAGRFAVTGLKPGRYEIHLNTQSGVAQFEIPESRTGIYDLGTLEVPSVTP